MRRIIVITAAVLGAIVIFIGVILFYAATNLNSITAERRQTILDKVSTSLGRPVHAADIKVSLGWGIMADVTGDQVADDPAVSTTQPFIAAGDVSTKLNLMPLLGRRIEVTEVVLDKPVIRIVQNRDGSYNVSTLGRNNAPTPKPQGKSSLDTLQVKDFSIKNGTVIYQAAGASTPATINSIDLTVRNFDFDSAFTVAVTFAALSDKQNFDLSATIGPLRKNGVLEVNSIPVSAKASV